MKKAKIIIILLLLAVFAIVGKETYSYLLMRVKVDVTSTSSNIVCDAEIANVTNEERSKLGYSEFKVIVKNYDTSNNLTKEPFNFKLTVLNENGSSGVFGYNNQFDNNLEINDQMDNSLSDNKTYIIQVKSNDGSASNVNYKVRVNCTQSN